LLVDRSLPAGLALDAQGGYLAYHMTGARGSGQLVVDGPKAKPWFSARHPSRSQGNPDFYPIQALGAGVDDDATREQHAPAPNHF
jgi:hypothetical protein